MNEYNEWRAKQGLKTIEEAPPVPEGVKTPKKPRMIALSEECWVGLQIIAHESGYDSRTKFLEAIGTRQWP
jgi:hypothetical protein